MHLDLDVPDFLDRNKNPIEPATAEDRAQFAPVPAAAPAEAKPEQDEQGQRDKKVKAQNRIARMKQKLAVRDIPEKYRKWDTATCQFYDTRKGKPKLSAKGAPKARSKPKGKDAKQTKRDKLITMLKRPNGASLGEMLRANPLKGKTPLATISAMVSVLKKDHKVERVGDDKGDKRRYRIV